MAIAPLSIARSRFVILWQPGRRCSIRMRSMPSETSNRFLAMGATSQYMSAWMPGRSLNSGRGVSAVSVSFGIHYARIATRCLHTAIPTRLIMIGLLSSIRLRMPRCSSSSTSPLM